MTGNKNDLSTYVIELGAFLMFFVIYLIYFENYKNFNKKIKKEKTFYIPKKINRNYFIKKCIKSEKYPSFKLSRISRSCIVNVVCFSK
jgi:hypothetical protein